MLSPPRRPRLQNRGRRRSNFSAVSGEKTRRAFLTAEGAFLYPQHKNPAAERVATTGVMLRARRFSLIIAQLEKHWEATLYETRR